MSRANRRARRDAKNPERESLVNKPKRGDQKDGVSGQHEIVDGRPSDQPGREQPTKEDQNKQTTSQTEAQDGSKVMWSLVARRDAIVAFLDRHGGSVGSISTAISAIGTIAIVALTCFYVGYSKKQWQTMTTANSITQKNLDLSQKAYVTLGRNDGVIADFVIPKDKAQNAEIIVYFQNSGHLPAKFAWGTMAGFLGADSAKKSTGITYTHPFKGLPRRTRDIKTGSTGEQGAADGVIAGGSIFVSTLGTISQKDLAELGPNNMGTLILGVFEYCDELGTHSSRQFGLRYRSNAPVSNLSFDLAWEGRSVFDMLPLPKPTNTTEYLPPCETTAEREQNQNPGKR